MAPQEVPTSSQAVVFAPAPELTVTIEQIDDRDEIHLHAGGQGFWVARLLRTLGVDTTLCGSFGGETGQVLRRLIEDSGIRVVAVEVDASNGGYVHDRRGGQRVEIGTQEPTPLSRHDLDDLYSATLAAAMGAKVCVLGGPNPAVPTVPADVYGRLCRDLRTNDTIVVADLSGEPRRSLLDEGAGADVLKTSDEDLVADGMLPGEATDGEVVAVMQRFARSRGGARHVVVTRGDRPALVLAHGELLSASGPRVDPLDPRGAGDSVTAGMAAGLARGDTFEAALRLGIAAATLNVTRHGLASGSPEAIAAMAGRVVIETVKRTGAVG